MIPAIIFSGLFYLAVVVLLLGVGAKIVSYARTPVPLMIPTTPAPIHQRGVWMRMAGEVFIFKSLFRASKWTWLFGMLFHYGMLLVLMRHLKYFYQPFWHGFAGLQTLGHYGAIAMMVGLLGLLGRRFFIDRIRYISTYSDYLMLFQLILLSASGMLMTLLYPPDLIQIKSFVHGWLTVNWQPLPASFLIMFHLAMVVLLMLIFPFSKLIHAVGLFFSPTRNMKDDPRSGR
jgi:nitrate reductase gamma subunit